MPIPKNPIPITTSIVVISKSKIPTIKIFLLDLEKIPHRPATIKMLDADIELIILRFWSGFEISSKSTTRANPPKAIITKDSINKNLFLPFMPLPP